MLAARLALHKGSTAGSWSGVAKSMCSVMLERQNSERYQNMKKRQIVGMLDIHFFA